MYYKYKFMTTGVTGTLIYYWMTLCITRMGYSRKNTHTPDGWQQFKKKVLKGIINNNYNVSFQWQDGLNWNVFPWLSFCC